MQETVIKLENISKQYRLGTVGSQTLRGDLQRWWFNMRGKDDPALKIGQSNKLDTIEGEYVWALRDINLEVKQGEILGIIGKNGAGKSTLLKLLSRVTGPTTGQIKIKGRIASLLEVGTGFHPELTGRENIFLNGAILGMTKNDIHLKFDEIVEFAGVAKYIDTPVKRYSSGMYVRLGFSVAAHLEPDILVVDEVLAVGDAEFQKKAIGKMQNVSQEGGRTVLFVSHNMQSVSSLTTKAVLIQKGEIIKNGETQEIISYYLTDKESKKDLLYTCEKSENTPYIKTVKLKTSYDNNIQAVEDTLEIFFEIFTPEKLPSPALSFQIFNSRNIPVVHILNLNEELPFCQKMGVTKLKAVIPQSRLYPDNYSITVHFADKQWKNKFETIENICPFEVKVFNQIRDYYWNKGNAIYLENVKWINSINE